METKLQKSIDYANTRCLQTKRHYLVTNEGHVWIDTPLNRSHLGDDLQCVYETKKEFKLIRATAQTFDCAFGRTGVTNA